MPSIEELERLYVLDDGVILKAGLFADVLHLEGEFPIGSAHPDYSQARARANLRRGRIYSIEDLRGLEIELQGLSNFEVRLDGEAMPPDVWHTMPYEVMIDQFAFERISSSFCRFRLDAEEVLYAAGEVSSLVYRERALTEPTG